ncbi:MAG: PadR family transcriptional regulator [Anaerolineales bacterium]
MTNAELAILSLISEKPRHGYEIESVIEERGMREWTEIGFSSIYYLLKKLEDEGLLEGDLEAAERGPARKVYHITRAGRDVLHAGVLESLSIPQHCYSPLQLGLANMPGIGQEEALLSLRKYHQALQERSMHIRERRDSQRPLPYFVEAVFEHSLTMIEAEQQWIEKFTRQVETERDDQD